MRHKHILSGEAFWSFCFALFIAWRFVICASSLTIHRAAAKWGSTTVSLAALLGGMAAAGDTTRRNISEDFILRSALGGSAAVVVIRVPKGAAAGSALPQLAEDAMSPSTQACQLRCPSFAPAPCKFAKCCLCGVK